jgi:hypothetical protein
VAFDGTVTSVTSLFTRELRTSAGEAFTLTEGQPVGHQTGAKVLRGWPVEPGFAYIYDRSVRPNWEWTTAAQQASRLLRPPPPQRALSVVAGIGSLYSRAFFDPITPHLEPGQQLAISRDDGLPQENLTVVGYDGDYAWLAGPVDRDFTGVATILPLARRSASFIEQPAIPVSTASALATAVTLGASSATIANASFFPPAGRVLLHVAGGIIGVDYFSISGNQLQELEWDADSSALVDSTGLLHPILPAGTLVTLFSAYVDQEINPAFVAAVQLRSPASVVTASNAKLLYDLISASVAIIETTAVNRPKALQDLLADIGPASTDILLFGKHVVDDTIDVSASDKEITLHEATVALLGSLVGGTPIVQTNPWTVAANVVELVLEAGITPPGTLFAGEQPEPYTYQWSLQITVGQPTAVLLTPDAPQTRLVGLSAGTYDITLVVRSNNGLEYERHQRIIVP